MKYRIVLLMSIYASYTLATYESLMTLQTEQVEMLADFKQELASIHATASIEWKNNQDVQSLIEQIERSIQQLATEQQEPFKMHIKHLFQETGINITFNQQNLIERLEEIKLMKRNQISNISKSPTKQSLDHSHPQPLTEQMDQGNYSYPLQKIKNIPYWQHKLSKKRTKRLLFF